MNITTALETLKNKGYEPIKAKDVQNVCLFLLGLDAESLKQIINDKNLPMIFRIVGKELLSEKGFEVIEKLLNRAIGKESIFDENENLEENEKNQTIIVNVVLPKEMSQEEAYDETNENPDREYFKSYYQSKEK